MHVLSSSQISDDERRNYLDIISSNDSPDKIVSRLNNKINGFFFEPSCCFSSELRWETAREMLDYNRSSIAECASVLTDCVEHFFAAAERTAPERLCAVNTDLTFDHVYSLNGEICIIDHEKRRSASLKPLSPVWYMILL